MKKLLFIAFILPFISFAQENNYWQQEVNYKISVKLDDEQHLLHGFIEMEYTNNAPDELNEIYIHLWPNAFKSKTSAFALQQIKTGSKGFHYANEENRGYIDSLDFKVASQKVSWKFDEVHEDIALLKLNQPLRTGEKIIISTPFKVKIPASYSRLGHVGQQYQITQWYPKPAVYDKDGWHPMPYLSQGEFYSEFGNFEVDITVPANYVVGASGNLQNQSELDFLQNMALMPITNMGDKTATPPSSQEWKTLKYKLDRAHDFAWFADKTYLVHQAEMRLTSGKVVKLMSLYNSENAKTWEDVLEYMEDAVLHYSHYLGEYPYDIVTTVDGALSAGAGMEYPTITVLGAPNKFMLEIVTMHEIGHNWFYGILASNERDHPWMDEGMNSYVEMRYMMKKYPDAKMINMLGTIPSFFQKLINYSEVDREPYRTLYEVASPHLSNLGADQPNNLASADFAPINYGVQVYQEPAMYFHTLENYLGHERMIKALNDYYDTWKFKHPQPEDVRASFEKSTGEDLSWFFEDLIGSNKKINFKIKSAKKVADGVEVKVKNSGSAVAPVQVSGMTKDGKEVASAWTSPLEGSETILLPSADIHKVQLDAGRYLPLMNRAGQVSRLKSPFKKTRPIAASPLGKWDDPAKNQLFYAPIIGGNTTDRFMFGMSLYNRTSQNKPISFLLSPMYSTGQNEFVGFGNIGYTYVAPESQVVIKPQLNYRKFAGFEKIEPEIKIDFPNPKKGNSAQQSIRLAYSMINIDQTILATSPENYNLLSTHYNWSKSNFLGPLQKITNLDGGLGLQTDLTDFGRLEGYFKYEMEYKRNRKISLRTYAGYMLFTANNLNPIFQLNPSGSPDPTMDHIFWDRAANTDYASALQYQTDGRQGGMRSFVPLAANSYLITSILDFQLPFSKRLTTWAEVGFMEEAQNPLYGFGLGYRIIPNMFEIYLPLVGSAFTNDVPENWREFQTNIRFLLKIDQRSVFEKIDGIIKSN